MNNLVTQITDLFAEFLSARHEHSQLVRELSSYTSRSDLLELDAILDRYPQEQTAELRKIIYARAA